ncbi:hypothetical protein [Anoxynatronum buryatiense]|uniref:DUF8052 domain-containing protein n=1 Tax=Anoxynatronum buryatiense TaxID=489973 RepID=A0AA45WYH3_9CLOT|nr:hypothetical protein [Anoxynatronum buryatiense]SMP69127.1 hypothetical protein SAMN06296020_1185 [Anoxynatronum buryatiense]
MEETAYLDLIEGRLAAYFDIERPAEYQRHPLAMYASSSIRNERYFASKKIKVYAIENMEHVFIKTIDRLTERNLEDFWQMLVKAADELPVPHEEHMSTIINGIILTTESPDLLLQQIIQKKKYEKSFLFGLKGWVYVRLVIVNLHDVSLVHNKRGKEVNELYGPAKPTLT